MTFDPVCVTNERLPFLGIKFGGSVRRSTCRPRRTASPIDWSTALPFGEPDLYQTVVETAGSPAILMPAGGEIEIPVAVNRGRKRAGDVEIDDIDLDPDLAQRLLDIGSRAAARPRRSWIAARSSMRSDSGPRPRCIRLRPAGLGLLEIVGIGGPRRRDRRRVRRRGIGPVAGLPRPYRKFSMKNGTSMAWTMARRNPQRSTVPSGAR